MECFDSILNFAARHSNDDPLSLLLQKERYPDINLSLVAQQLEGRRQARVKWPTIAERESYFYPPKLNREQSSSEATARYKAHIAAKLQPHSMADLTGGMGIDLLFMAPLCSHADYIELDADLCAIMRHNIQALAINNIDCHNTDSITYLSSSTNRYSLLYIDPARRDNKGRRVVSFEDCTPNLVTHLPLLRDHCDRLLVKASPMIDIHTALNQLGNVAEIHIVSVGNECKEVLFLSGDTPEPDIHCADITTTGITCYTFTPSSEQAAEPCYATQAETYLYEPNAAIMKSGGYNSLCQHYRLSKLSRNTHLYTSHNLITGFPGRIFEILQSLPLNAKAARHALPEGKAHVATRNYPLSAAQLQRQLKLSEGGNLFVIAATLGTRPQGWLCRRVDPNLTRP